MYNFIGKLHHKNEIGVKLMQNAGMEVGIDLKNSSSEDWNIHCSDIVPATSPRTLYGPQIDFRKIMQFKTSHPVNFLSEWVCKCAKTFNPTINPVALPFPIEIDKFIPESRSKEPILYFKEVDYNLYKSAYKYFKSKFRNIKVFDYEKTYKEEKYNKAISNAPFAIWLGRHESQGFALQECLSADCPIFVIDVKDMSEEVMRSGRRYWGEPGPFFPATAAPYFDERCGLISFPEKYKTDFEIFYANLKNYSPRNYIIENLSAKALVKHWTDILK